MSEIADAMEQMPFEDWYEELMQIYREGDYEFPDDEDAWQLYWEDFYSQMIKEKYLYLIAA